MNVVRMSAVFPVLNARMHVSIVSLMDCLASYKYRQPTVVSDATRRDVLDPALCAHVHVSGAAFLGADASCCLCLSAQYVIHGSMVHVREVV